MNTQGDQVSGFTLRPQVVDRFEQSAIVLLWLWLSYRVAMSDNPLAPLLLVSEGTVVLFVLLRRRTDTISVNLRDWLLAFAGTAAPMLVDPAAKDGWAVPGAALFMIGTIVQLGAKLSLRRSFGVVPANRGVKTGGMYRLVRHPMYSGYMLSQVGALLIMPSLWNALVYALAWGLQIYRLVLEERLLSRDPVYASYQQAVPHRLVPGLF